MIVENDWLTTNIKEKAKNNTLDFSIKIKSYDYQKVSFDVACANLCNKIISINKDIFVGFSGGIDSEFVVRKLMKHNIPFTAIVARTCTNRYEMMYAENFFRENPNINKIILDISNPKLFFEKYIDICKTFNVAAVGSVGAIESAKFAKQQNGIFILGEHLIGTKHDLNNTLMIESAEWDHYYDVLVGGETVLPFFTYDLPIVQSYVSEFNSFSHDTFKSSLYSLPFRPKFKYTFENIRLYDVFLNINRRLKNSGKSVVEMTKDKLLSDIG